MTFSANSKTVSFVPEAQAAPVNPTNKMVGVNDLLIVANRANKGRSLKNEQRPQSQTFSL